LNPKKTKELCKLTSQELGLSEELVRDVIDMYWKEVHDSISDMRHPFISVYGLGTFKVKEWKLQESLDKYERLLTNNDGENFQRMAIRYELLARIEKIKRAQELLKTHKEKKEIKNQEKHDRLKSNLEKQMVDSTGNIQLDIQERTNREDLHKENEDM